MGKGLVIEGNRHPTERDVDDLIERKGSIEEAFDGAWAEEGAGGQIVQWNGQVCVTEKVAYGVFGQGRYLWLIVVDRRVPDHCVGFRADASGGVFRRNKIRDQRFVEHASLVERALQGWKNSKIGPSAPDHALVPVSRQVAPSDVERMRVETDYSLQRVQFQGWMQNAFVLLLLGGVAYTGYTVHTAMLGNVQGLTTQVSQLQNTAAANQVQIKGLQQEQASMRDDIEDHDREIRIAKRLIRDLEDQNRGRGPPAIEGTPNKTQGNEVGFVQPNGGSNQILAWIGGIAIFILGVWLCMVRISDDYNAKRRYKRK